MTQKSLKTFGAIIINNQKVSKRPQLPPMIHDIVTNLRISRAENFSWSRPASEKFPHANPTARIVKENTFCPENPAPRDRRNRSSCPAPDGRRRLAVSLAACSKPVPKVEDVRPVRAIVLSSSNVDVSAELAGEVVPLASQLGFRVGGKIVARKVDVGAVVKKGN
jgi:hypothetical protein